MSLLIATCVGCCIAILLLIYLFSRDEIDCYNIGTMIFVIVTQIALITVLLVPPGWATNKVVDLCHVFTLASIVVACFYGDSLVCLYFLVACLAALFWRQSRKSRGMKEACPFSDTNKDVFLPQLPSDSAEFFFGLMTVLLGGKILWLECCYPFQGCFEYVKISEI